MTRKTSGYGAACYYAGKLVGRCTPADAQGYEQLMKSCGGNAARVLQEYAYFSPELRGILEKVAAVQAKESRTAGIFQSPRLSPWGDVQTSDTLCPGVFMVSTASHGGTMVALDMAAILSPAARKCGLKMGDYLCFEEDCDENIVLRNILRATILTHRVRPYKTDNFYYYLHKQGKEASKVAQGKNTTAPKKK